MRNQRNCTGGWTLNINRNKERTGQSFGSSVSQMPKTAEWALIVMNVGSPGHVFLLRHPSPHTLPESARHWTSRWWIHDNLSPINGVKLYIQIDAGLIVAVCCPIGSSLCSDDILLFVIPSTQPRSACPVRPTSSSAVALLLMIRLRAFVRYLLGRFTCQTTRSTGRSARYTMLRNRSFNSRASEICEGLSDLIGKYLRKSWRSR